LLKLPALLTAIRCADFSGEMVLTSTKSLPSLPSDPCVLIYSLDRGLDLEQAGDAASVALDRVEQAVHALDAVALKHTDT
jgi:hypothetical protein